MDTPPTNPPNSNTKKAIVKDNPTINLRRKAILLINQWKQINKKRYLT
jgi:hypothetical protein